MYTSGSGARFTRHYTAPTNTSRVCEYLRSLAGSLSLRTFVLCIGAAVVFANVALLLLLSSSSSTEEHHATGGPVAGTDVHVPGGTSPHGAAGAGDSSILRNNFDRQKAFATLHKPAANLIARTVTPGDALADPAAVADAAPLGDGEVHHVNARTFSSEVLRSPFEITLVEFFVSRILTSQQCMFCPCCCDY